MSPEADAPFLNGRGVSGVARILRVKCPPLFPVRVSRVPLVHHGQCSFIRGRKRFYFVIELNRGLTLAHQIDVLLHEWAHALSWTSESHEIDHHGPEWGIAMSRVYQAVFEK